MICRKNEKRPLTAALVGLGNIAWKYDANRPDAPFPLTQAGAFLAHPRIHLVAGCSTDPSDCEGFEAWSGVSSFSSLDEMFAAVTPDIVGVCSPTTYHAEHVRECIKRGVRALWLEKPPGVSAQEAQGLDTLARENAVPVCVNYFRRYQDIYVKASQLLTTTLGRCHTIHITYSPGLARNGCHLLDQALFLTQATSAELLWVDGASDPLNPFFAARLPAGTMLLGMGADVEYHSNSLQMVCDEGIITIYRGGEGMRLEQKVPNLRFPGFFCLQENVIHPEENSLDNYMLPPLEDLIEALHQKRDCKSSLKTAHLSQQLLEEILKNAIPKNSVCSW